VSRKRGLATHPFVHLATARTTLVEVCGASVEDYKKELMKEAIYDLVCVMRSVVNGL
jgi:hypothetical protein